MKALKVVSKPNKKNPSRRKLPQKKSLKTRPHPLQCRSTPWAIRALQLLKMLIQVRKRTKITSKNHLTTCLSRCRLSATLAVVKTYWKVKKLSAKRSCASSRSTLY